MPIHRRVVKLCYNLTTKHQAAFRKLNGGRSLGTFKSLSEKIKYKRVSMMCYHHAKYNRIKNRNLLLHTKGIWERHSRNYRDCLTVVGWWERQKRTGYGMWGWGEEERILLGISLWF